METPPKTSGVIQVALGVVTRRYASVAEVLITRRPDSAIYGGFWELPGGKVHEDESPVDCVRRELLEELGIEVRVSSPLTTVDYDYPHGRVRLHPYFCQIVRGEPHNLAVAEHRWVGASELAAYAFPPANADLMRAIAQALSAPDAATSIGDA